MERAIKLTADYTKERTAFGKPLMDFQNAAFRLARAQDRSDDSPRLRRMVG